MFFTPYCAILQYSTPDMFPVLCDKYSTAFLLILHLCTFVCMCMKYYCALSTRRFLRYDKNINCDRVEASIISWIRLHQPDPRSDVSFSILNFIIRCIFHRQIYSFQFCALMYIKAFPKILKIQNLLCRSFC